MMTSHKTMLVVMLAVLILGAGGCSAGEPSGRTEREPRASSARESAIPAPARKIYRDLEYGNLSRRQTLDLFLPETGDGPFPLIVYIHGGGYVAGSKDELFPAMIQAARRHGYAIASIDYRLLDEGDYPAQIRDVKAAIRWLKAHAEEYAIDERAIATWGFSAGGHLAALAGTSGFVTELEEPSAGEQQGPNSSVQAAIDLAGPANFFELEKHLEKRRRWGIADPSYELTYLSDEVRTRPDVARSADPATHADPGDPPILIQHGRLDGVVPVSQSEGLAKTLRERVGPEKVELRIEEAAGHTSPVFRSDAYIEQTLDWLDSALER